METSKIHRLMKIRPLFNRYQKFLVAFANTGFGRNYIDLGQHPKSLRVVGVYPDSIHYEVEKGLYQAVFHSRSPYLMKFRLALEGMAIVESELGSIRSFLEKPEFVVPHFQDLISPRSYLPLLMRRTQTFNPDADTETTSVDGSLMASWADGVESWASLRVGSGGNDTAQDSTGSANIARVKADNDGANWRDLMRAIFKFDTSSLSDKATVDSGTFSIYFTSADGGDFGDALTLTQGYSASDTALNFSNDWGTNAGYTTKFADTNINITSLTTSAYNDWALNSGGLGEIDLTGIAGYSLKYEADRVNSTLTWSSLAVDQSAGYYAENGSNEPKLVVNYTLPPGGNPMNFGGGVAVA